MVRSALSAYISEEQMVEDMSNDAQIEEQARFAVSAC